MRCVGLTVLVFAAQWGLAHVAAADEAQDRVIVETVLRLPSFDLASSAKAQAAVDRFIRSHPESDESFQLIERFKLVGQAEVLRDLALEKPSDTSGVRAATLLLKFGQGKLLADRLRAEEPRTAEAAATALGAVGSSEAVDILLPAVTDKQVPSGARLASVQALGQGVLGQRRLLELVRNGALPSRYAVVVGDALHASPDASLREAAAVLLPRPEGAGAAPLPPIAALVKRRGNPQTGAEVFVKKGTCAKCHVVGEQGKEIGPNLSQIGAKLSREAMYVAILAPSAGISHNYENWSVVTEQGQIFNGILVSRTDDGVTLRSADGIERNVPAGEIDEIAKLPTSLMPADLQKTMTEQELIDLVEYLTTLKP